MKVAIIGSRSLNIDHLEKYLPSHTTHIVSGGARGVDHCAKEYALAHNIPFTEVLPEYKRYGRAAPLKRNILIVKEADYILAFWDGQSRGTKFVIEQCRILGKPHRVITRRA